MFSETRYARNGDLRVAYRTSREGPRDLVFVQNWFTICEVTPELPSLQGWVEAMTSLGRLIFLDQPGAGASDPVTPGAPPNLEQWADSITAVLDDLKSREAALIAVPGALPAAALFAATHPSRTAALVALEGYADPMTERSDGLDPEEVLAAFVGIWGTWSLSTKTRPPPSSATANLRAGPTIWFSPTSTTWPARSQKSSTTVPPTSPSLLSRAGQTQRSQAVQWGCR
jgi:pimeloyl-ACP methyl ester carboxylesterase